MKRFLVLMIMASFFSGIAFAAETDTDCLATQDSNSRGSSKQQSGVSKHVKEKPKSSIRQ